MAEEAKMELVKDENQNTAPAEAPAEKPAEEKKESFLKKAGSTLVTGVKKAAVPIMIATACIVGEKIGEKIGLDKALKTLRKPDETEDSDEDEVDEDVEEDEDNSEEEE